MKKLIIIVSALALVVSCTTIDPNVTGKRVVVPGEEYYDEYYGYYPWYYHYGYHRWRWVPRGRSFTSRVTRVSHPIPRGSSGSSRGGGGCACACAGCACACAGGGR